MSQRKLAWDRVQAALKPSEGSLTKQSVAKPKPEPSVTPVRGQPVTLSCRGRSLLPSKRGSVATPRGRPSSVPVLRRPTAALQASGAGSLALQGELTTCEASTVSQLQTLQHFHEFDKELKIWAQANGRSLCLEQLELSLMDFLDYLLVDGQKACDAKRAIAAALHFTPGGAKKDLKRMGKALWGVGKRRPGRSKLPLPVVLSRGAAAAGFLHNFMNLARRNLMQFYMKMRPDESGAVKERDVRPPTGAPLEHLAPSKTQTLDNSMIAG